MRNPNGYGSVYKLKGKRRKPWVARITTGWEKTETGKLKQLYKPLGYFAKQSQAINALAEYNKDPYDLENAGMTFKELYELWSDKHFEKLSASTVEGHKISYKKCEPLYDRPFKNIKLLELQEFLDTSCSTYATKQQVKKLLGLMYFYANKYEITDKDHSKKLDLGEKQTTLKRRAFTQTEINKLWNNIDMEWVDVILMLIYTGLRISELLELKIENIDLVNLTMTGGKKTKASKDRIIPIHPRILPLIKKRYDENNKYLIVGKRTIDYMSYRGFITYKYTPVMKKLSIKTSGCHDCRHTIASNLRTNGVDPLIIKRILGHSSEDLTEKVYTHTTIEELKKAINTLK